MKKFATMVLALMMVAICSFSCAEGNFPHMEGNLELRGGITYGATQNDIISFEKEKGNTKYERQESYDPSGDHTLVFKADVAGVQNSKIHYCFDKQNNFIGFGYEMPGGKTHYNTMYDTLTQKYGAPMATGDSMVKSLASDIMLRSQSVLNRYLAAGTRASVTDSAQWLVAYDDCWLLIDIHVYSISSQFAAETSLRIGYKVYSQDEIQQIIGEQEKTIQRRNTDL